VFVASEVELARPPKEKWGEGGSPFVDPGSPNSGVRYEVVAFGKGDWADEMKDARMISILLPADDQPVFKGRGERRVFNYWTGYLRPESKMSSASVTRPADRRQFWAVLELGPGGSRSCGGLVALSGYIVGAVPIIHTFDKNGKSFDDANVGLFIEVFLRTAHLARHKR